MAKPSIYLDMGTVWKASLDDDTVFEGRDRKTGELQWTGTRVDLVFGSNSQLRALCEVYAGEDAKEKFVTDFIAAWDKAHDRNKTFIKKGGVSSCIGTPPYFS